MPVDNGLLIGCVALLALAAILTLIVLAPLIVWSSKRKSLFITAWLIVAGVLVVLAVVGGAAGMQSPPPIRPIERQLDITDRDGALTVRGFHLAPPREGVARLDVRVSNASEEARYLGVEYYVDAGQVADIFSPGAMSQAMVKEVAPGFSGAVTFDLAMPPLARDSSLVIVLARCNGAEDDGVRLDPESEALHQERIQLTEE